MPILRNKDNVDDAIAKKGGHDSRPALRPPQFTLSTLLWVIGGCGVLFAAMTAAGPIGAFALLLLVLAIIAHVAGNAIGTRLREIGSVKPQEEVPVGAAHSVSRDQFAPETPLCRRTALSRAMIASTAIGAVLFGVIGSAALFWLTWGQVNLPTAIVAIGSSSVLGALAGFTCSSFAQIAGGAWWQARSGVK
jgi:hypothetical protein